MDRLCRMGRLICLAIVIVGWVMVSVSHLHAAQWSVVKTRYLTLHYQNVEDLDRFDRQIDFKDFSGTFFGFLKRGRSIDSFEDKMVKKLDALVQKVQRILDMRKAIMINVKIFPDETALHAEYFKIYRKKKKLRAWYIYEYNTVYVNARDLHSGMLAHECAHAIIDHYLAVRPPRATAEILATYVDAHLYEEAKVY